MALSDNSPDTRKPQTKAENTRKASKRKLTEILQQDTPIEEEQEDRFQKYRGASWMSDITETEEEGHLNLEQEERLQQLMDEEMLVLSGDARRQLTNSQQRTDEMQVLLSGDARQQLVASQQKTDEMME